MLSDGARPNHRTSIVNQRICSRGAGFWKLAGRLYPVNPGWEPAGTGRPAARRGLEASKRLFPRQAPAGACASSAPGRNRTFNLGIKSPLLCQLSYRRTSSARNRPSHRNYCKTRQGSTPDESRDAGLPDARGEG